MKDMIRKSRGRGVVGLGTGEGNPAAKLSDADVLEIRRLYWEGLVFQQDIADQFGVHRETVGRIVRGTSRAGCDMRALGDEA